MNKAEIIRKISKKAGVPDTEAKKFFEIFLKHASDLLKPGESLKIHGIGSFQLRVGQIENRNAHASGENFLYSDLIVFTDPENNEPSENEETIFNVPSGIEEQYQPVDSYFSLSIGKPIIPLKGVNETEFFIPPSGTELRSLLESKIDRLLDAAEKTEGGKETETILLKPGEELSEDKSISFSEVDSPVEIKVPNRSDFLKTREFEDLSWDFGENLSQEIEEESILDIEKEPETIEPAYIHEKIEKRPVEPSPLFEEETGEESSDEDIFEEIIDEEIGETDIYEENAEEVIKEQPEKSSEENEEDIQELQTETGIITDSPVPEQKTAEIPEVPEKTAHEEPVLRNYQRVKSLTKEFNNTEFNDTEETEEEKPKKITEVRGGYQKVRRTTAEFDFDLSGIKGLDEIEEPPADVKKSPFKEYQGYRTRSSIPSLIVGLAVIIAMAGVIFLYMKLKNANVAADNQTDVIKQQPKVIERDYNVPVTYPYQKAVPEDSEGTSAGTPKNDKTQITSGTSKASSQGSEIKDPVNAERIGNYIYKYPEGIVVQVSSWKSKAIAMNEVNRYRKAGRTAFAEVSDIPGMGTYYRIRVGYFKSLQEAQNFVNGQE